jgi:hypothetical protein
MGATASSNVSADTGGTYGSSTSSSRGEYDYDGAADGADAQQQHQQRRNMTTTRPAQVPELYQAQSQSSHGRPQPQQQQQHYQHQQQQQPQQFPARGIATPQRAPFPPPSISARRSHRDDEPIAIASRGSARKNLRSIPRAGGDDADRDDAGANEVEDNEDDEDDGSADADADDAADAAESLRPCPDCGRKFNPHSFERHVRVCREVFAKKRAQFDMAAARTGDLDLQNVQIDEVQAAVARVSVCLLVFSCVSVCLMTR